MSHKKQAQVNIKRKKYDSEIDVIPLHPSGFGIATHDKENEMLMLDFLYDVRKDTTHIDRVVLGSYALTKRMANDMIKLLTQAVDDLDSKANEGKDDSQ